MATELEYAVMSYEAYDQLEPEKIHILEEFHSIPSVILGNREWCPGEDSN